MHVPEFGFGKYRQAVGCFGKAPEHQWRVKRYGIETVGCYANRRAVSCGCCDDGDTGGKCAQRGTEGFGVEVIIGHGLPLLAGESGSSITAGTGAFIVLMD